MPVIHSSHIGSPGLLPIVVGETRLLARQISTAMDTNQGAPSPLESMFNISRVSECCPAVDILAICDIARRSRQDCSKIWQTRDT